MVICMHKNTVSTLKNVSLFIALMLNSYSVTSLYAGPQTTTSNNPVIFIENNGSVQCDIKSTDEQLRRYLFNTKTKITSLDLYGCSQLTFNRIPWQSTLESINLSWTNISAHQLNAVCLLCGNSLKELNLSYCQNIQFDMVTWESFTCLDTLYLFWTPITEDQIKIILNKLPHIKIIH